MQFRLNIWDVLVLLCVSTVFFILVVPAAGLPSLGDEWLWVYESKLILSGVLPYRDYFHSHAPFHILAVIITRLLTGGEYLPVFRLAPALFTLFSGCLVYRTVRRNTSIIPALISCLLFLFSFRVLSHALHFTGWNLLVLFLLIALDQFLSRRMISAGAALGAASLTNLLGGFGVYAFLVLLLLKRDWRSIGRLILGISIVTLPVVLFCFAISGTEFINQIFLYQVSKPLRSGEAIRDLVISSQLKRAHPVYLLALASLIPMLFDKNSFCYRNHILTSALLLCGLALLFMYLLPHPYSYYMITAAPFAVISAGYCVSWILELWYRSIGWKRIISGILIFACAILILRSTVPNAIRFGQSRAGFHENFAISYTIAKSVDELLPPGSPIHGTFSIVPTIALLTGRRISGNETDTSSVRFLSGVTNFDEFIQNVEDDTPGGIITIEGGSIGSYEPYMIYVNKHYHPAVVFNDPNGIRPIISLWVRNDIYKTKEERGERYRKNREN